MGNHFSANAPEHLIQEGSGGSEAPAAAGLTDAPATAAESLPPPTTADLTDRVVAITFVALQLGVPEEDLVEAVRHSYRRVGLAAVEAMLRRRP